MSMVSIGALVVGSAATYAGQKKASDAARDANRKNIAAEQERNDLNYKQFLLGRGSEGNALLPMYFGDGEEEIGQLAIDAVRKLFGYNDNIYDYGENVLKDSQESIDIGDTVMQSIFDGSLEDQRLRNAKPVQDARKGVATARKNAVRDSLNKAIIDMRSRQGAKGFQGGSSFERNQLLRTSIDSNNEIADAMSRAVLANAEDNRAIRDGISDFQIGNLSLPLSRIQQKIAARATPATTAAQVVSSATQPLDFFRMGEGRFRYEPLPQIQPNVSDGQIASAGIASLAKAAGSGAFDDIFNKPVAQQQRQAIPVFQKFDATIPTYDVTDFSRYP